MKADQRVAILEKQNDDLMSVLLEYIEKYGLTDRAIVLFQALHAFEQHRF